MLIDNKLIAKIGMISKFTISRRPFNNEKYNGNKSGWKKLERVVSIYNT
jgi:hypothetical protein